MVPSPIVPHNACSHREPRCRLAAAPRSSPKYCPRLGSCELHTVSLFVTPDLFRGPPRCKIDDLWICVVVVVGFCWFCWVVFFKICAPVRPGAGGCSTGRPDRPTQGVDRSTTIRFGPSHASATGRHLVGLAAVPGIAVMPVGAVASTGR